MVLQKRHTAQEFSAGGIVFKKENAEIRWLVTQHSQNKKWSFPKGLIGDKVDGEKKEKTAVREVHEEGGIEARIVSKEPFVNKYYYVFNNTRVFKTVYFFLMKYLSGDIKDHDFEVSEAKWLSKEKVLQTLSFPADKKIFLEATKLVNGH